MSQYTRGSNLSESIEGAQASQGLLGVAAGRVWGKLAEVIFHHKQDTAVRLRTLLLLEPLPKVHILKGRVVAQSETPSKEAIAIHMSE
jgi:hypothetical protein